MAVEIKADMLPDRLINLTPIQIQLLKDEHRFIFVDAGRQSRKTLISKRKLLIKALDNPNHKYLLAAPTFAQAKQIFWDELKRETTYLREGEPSETELSITLKNGTLIKVVGLDKPHRFEGVGWNGIVITEFGDVKPDGWKKSLRPTLTATNGWAIFDGVPNTMGYQYELALIAAGGVIPKTKPFYGAYAESSDNPEYCYYSWFSADVLSKEEISELRRTMSARDFRQQFEGSFEGSNLQAYHAFSGDNVVTSRPDQYRGAEIIAGMDFNVSKMCCGIGYKLTNGVHFFDEIILRNSNTFEMADVLFKKYPNIKIYPDASGNAKSSSATASDHEILRAKGFRIMAWKANPPVNDRINAVNALLMNAEGEIRLTVEKDKCPQLVGDFQRVQRKDNGDLDKSDMELTHISDAVGYLIEFNFPIKRSRVTGIQRTG